MESEVHVLKQVKVIFSLLLGVNSDTAWYGIRLVLFGRFISRSGFVRCNEVWVHHVKHIIQQVSYT